QHSVDPKCRSCHSIIDPLGFGFEHYDGIGVRRDIDNNKPVDASGEIIGARDPELRGPFSDMVELSNRLTNSRPVHDCMASNFFRFALGRADGPDDECSLADVQQQFWDSQGRFATMQLAIIMSSSFRTRATPEVSP